MEEYLVKYNEWLTNPAFDEETKKELEAIKEDDNEIKERFYKDLEFGTAGLRGIIGSGTNRMNKYTVTKSTQGLAQYILKQNGQDKGVVIAYDSRRKSKEFSEQTALCLNANGIKTYIFDDVRPTPELSYAIRKLKCISGIVITASHNPPEYNGYKVYWDDGAQIVAPVDAGIMEEINNIKDFSIIKTIEKNEAIEKGLYHIVGEEIDNSYIEELKKLVINPEVIKEEQKNIKIVYTPLHGTGAKLAKRILKEVGFENVYVVESQEKPDGEFPTVEYPNPEVAEAFKMALELAHKVDADIVVANDPDADRFGMYVKDKDTGDYIKFTGNMSANLTLEYIISQKKEKGTLPHNAAVISTIVSSNMTKAICDYYNVKLFRTITGFKNIAKIIRDFEENGNTYECIYSYEESYGCIIGTHARDKDGIVALMGLSEITAFYKKQGKTLWDAMKEMYNKYGYYKEDQVSISLKGIEGAMKIKQMMEDMRNNPAKNFGKYIVEEIEDLDIGRVYNNITGEIKECEYPKSNVIYYKLNNDCWCCARPSGTEPKIKFYIGVKANSEEEANEGIEEIKKYLLK